MWPVGQPANRSILWATNLPANGDKKSNKWWNDDEEKFGVHFEQKNWGTTTTKTCNFPKFGRWSGQEKNQNCLNS